MLYTQAVLEEQEQMKELLTSMFIDNHREGRDLEEDMDEEEVGEARDMDDEGEDESNLVDDEADAEEGGEVVSSNDPQEIARFNNYMDAIYRCIAQPAPKNNHWCAQLCIPAIDHCLSVSGGLPLSPISTFPSQEDERCPESQADGSNGPQYECEGGKEGEEG